AMSGTVAGVTVDPAGVKLDVAAMQAYRAGCVQQTNAGIAYLFRKYKVASLCGVARLMGPAEGGWAVSIKGEGFETAVVARDVIVACGSRARELPGMPFDEKLILSSAGALTLPEVPGRLGIIGAGIIALELGSVWRRLGARVTLFIRRPNLLPMADPAIGREARKIFTQQGLDLRFGVKLGEVVKGEGEVTVRYADADGNACEERFDKLIVAAGRDPATESINPAAAGLELDRRGAIVVDELCRTNQPGIWAIGDAVRGPMLAHKAEEEGIAVAERIAGRAAVVHLERVPSVIYTEPEIAWVGLNEEEARAAGYDAAAASAPFKANGRARASHRTEGFAKVVIDRATDMILGVHIIGPDAGELIAEACAAIAFGATAEDLGLVCHAHPTFSEAVREAALAVRGEAVNI
ncbi:MAG: dihydrolipoyl dehydrogenase, partial [Duodenibacillus sp.]|nr:dihydrolipoyl dehydrogenase [Duodenibacillus sp.]